MLSQCLETQQGYLIVAHPDDETIFAAGFLLRTGWPVTCLTTPERDPWRAEQFLDACKVLGVCGTIHDQRENGKTVLVFNGRPEGIIISHGFTGEYGHPHHIQVYDHFKPNISFGYPSGEFILELTPEEQKTKLKAMQCYTEKWKDYLDIFPVWEREFYDSSCPSGREILSQICRPI